LGPEKGEGKNGEKLRKGGTEGREMWERIREGERVDRGKRE